MHANDASDIVFVVARRRRVFVLFRSPQDILRCALIVIVCVWIDSEPAWYEPASAVFLLACQHEQLKPKEGQDTERADRVSLLVQKVPVYHLHVEGQEALHGAQTDRHLERGPSPAPETIAVDYLGQPDGRVEKHDCPGAVDEHVLENDGGEDGHVKENVEPGEHLALELLVVQLLLGELGAPRQDEQPRLEREAVDEVPESGQGQVLHVFSVEVHRELEVNREEEKVPQETHAQRNGRKALCQRVVLRNLLDEVQGCEECQYNDHCHSEAVVGNPGQVGLNVGLFQRESHLIREKSLTF